MAITKILARPSDQGTPTNSPCLISTKTIYWWAWTLKISREKPL